MASVSTSEEDEYEDEPSVLWSRRLADVKRGTVMAGDGGRMVIGIGMDTSEDASRELRWELLNEW